MAHRRHGDDLGRQIETAPGEPGRDPRKALLKPRGVEVRRIQIHVVGAVAAHLGDHGAHHHVARGEFGALVVLQHEALPGRVAQVGALAAQGLGDELHGLLAVEGQARGMELHELQIADGRAGAIRHGDTIAGGDQRVGGAAVHLAGAAGGEDRHHGHVEREAAVVQVEGEGADAAPAHGEEVDDELVLVQLDPTSQPGGFGQGARDLAAGGVAAGVQDPRHGVRALTPEYDLTVHLVEARTDLHELAYAVGPLVDEHVHRLVVAQSGARIHGVLEVQLGRV